MRSNIVLAALFAFFVCALVLCVLCLIGLVNTKQQFCFEFSINMAFARARIVDDEYFPSEFIRKFSSLYTFLFTMRCSWRTWFLLRFQFKFINTYISFFTLLAHHKPDARINTRCVVAYSYTKITNRIGMMLWWLIVSILIVIVTERTINQSISFPCAMMNYC